MALAPASGQGVMAESIMWSEDMSNRERLREGEKRRRRTGRRGRVRGRTTAWRDKARK